MGQTTLDELTPAELAMLGHSLRMVPDNACLTGRSAALQGNAGLLFYTDAAAFKSLWNKVAEAIRERSDMEPFRHGS
jgi:hypothetical protein